MEGRCLLRAPRGAWRAAPGGEHLAVFLLNAQLVARREVARGMFVLSIEAPQVAESVRAGQFVNLGWTPGPLLRRPFSVYRTEAEGDEVIWATDDGSQGFAGTAVAAVPDSDLVLACGPNRMLAAVASRWPEAQVAVETYMGCGTGVCLGCAVPLERGGYDRSC